MVVFLFWSSFTSFSPRTKVPWPSRSNPKSNISLISLSFSISPQCNASLIRASFICANKCLKSPNVLSAGSPLKSTPQTIAGCNLWYLRSKFMFCAADRMSSRRFIDMINFTSIVGCSDFDTLQKGNEICYNLFRRRLGMAWRYSMASMTAVMYSSFVIVGVWRGVVLNSKYTILSAAKSSITHFVANATASMVSVKSWAYLNFLKPLGKMREF